jgi:hypothetical protein
MTVDALRGKSAGRGEPDALPIGEADANIFDCPSCGRPLATGTRRCPGCSTRLVAGIRATKAAGFLAAGIAIGAFIGAGVTGGVVLLAGPTTASVEGAPAVAPSAAPASSAPVASAPGPITAPSVPATAVSALRQSTMINQRLATDATRLSVALAMDEPSASEIARVLRALAANAAFGDRIAPDVADWTDAAAVSAGLVEFYATIGGTARDGLSYSLTSPAAYVAAGREMLAVMAGLPTLDAAARSVAEPAGIDLPPLTIAADGDATAP